jgi:hypothetical protein
MKKKIGLLIAVLFLIVPILKISAQTNAGFVPANIWYSKDPFEEGDKIQIYTLIFNPDARELSGTVSFFDKSTLLGKKNVTVPPKGVKDISINWTATAGDHTIFAQIENTKFLVSSGKYEEVRLEENKTDESKRSVDKKIVEEKKNDTKDGEDAPFTEKVADKVDQTVSSITDKIAESTPSFISVPLIASANALEKLRTSVGGATEAKKTDIKADIQKLDSVKKSDDGKKPSLVLKPWKYVELFFMTIFSFIFNHKFIYYILFFALLMWVLRYIYRLVV